MELQHTSTSSISWSIRKERRLQLLFRWLLNSGFILSVFTFINTKLIATPTLAVHHIPILILLPLLLLSYRTIPVPLLWSSLLFFIPGVVHIALGNNTPALFFKVFIALYINFLFYYYFIKYHHFDIASIFSIYMKGAVFCSYFMLFEAFCYGIGFRPGYDFAFLGVGYGSSGSKILPSAFFLEPAHYAGALSPAIFIAMHNLIRRRKDYMGTVSSIAVIAGIIFAFSSTGYIALFLCLILIAINYRAITILLSSLIVGVGGFWVLYTSVPKFQERVFASVEIVSDANSIESDSKLNASALILYHHFYIATENFKHHPIAGTGLGGHPIAHERYSPFNSKAWWVNLNKEDACSMLIRLISETGTLGLVLLFWFLWRNFVSRKHAANELTWLLSNGILVLIFVNLLRMGNYMVYGFPGFILMYYYNRLNNSAALRSRS